MQNQNWTIDRLKKVERGSQDFYTFYFVQGNETFHELGKCDTYFLSPETAGGFAGV